MRIGVDVGGTNTDAVVMDGAEVVGWTKTPTTPDVSHGIITALERLLDQTRAPKGQRRARTFHDRSAGVPACRSSDGTAIANPPSARKIPHHAERKEGAGSWS